jgi:hypothetical protein
MAYRVDLTKTPKQILVDRINYVFGVSYTTDNIDFNDKGVQPLTKDDIMIEPISEELDSYDVRLVPNHLSFKGTIPVVFTDPTPRTLASLVTKLALDGFRPGELINV